MIDQQQFPQICEKVCILIVLVTFLGLLLRNISAKVCYNPYFREVKLRERTPTFYNSPVDNSRIAENLLFRSSRDELFTELDSLCNLKHKFQS